APETAGTEDGDLQPLGDLVGDDRSVQHAVLLGDRPRAGLAAGQRATGLGKGGLVTSEHLTPREVLSLHSLQQQFRPIRSRYRSAAELPQPWCVAHHASRAEESGDAKVARISAAWDAAYDSTCCSASARSSGVRARARFSAFRQTPSRQPR